MKNLFISMLCLLLIGCSALTGEEVGRLAINQVSQDGNTVMKEATVDLEAGDQIIFWSDIDFEYQGDVELRFRISIKKGEKDFGNLEVDPTATELTLNESKNTSNGKTTWSFFGQNAAFNVQEDGRYTFQSILVSSENNTLVIKKAELVLKKI